MRYHMRKNVSKLIPALLILALLTLLLPATALALGTEAQPHEIDLATGPYIITEEGYYLLKGTTTNSFVITANCTVILDGVNIASDDGPAIFINGAHNVTIILKEGTTNILKGGTQGAGLELWSTSVLTLQGPGAIEATGGRDSAGIGGSGGGSGGTITITGGAWVTATGEGAGAGIGGGGSGGTIHIEAATVKAQGGDLGGAGIGGGAGGSGGSIYIGAGADVTAVGGNGYQGGDLSYGGGAGIGGGGGVGNAPSPTGGAAGRIEIDARAVISAKGGKGGTHTASGSYSGGGAAIGGGGGAADGRQPSPRYGAGGEADKNELILPAAWYTAPQLEGGAGASGAQAGAVIGTGGWAASAAGPENQKDYVKEFYPDWPTVPLLYDYAPRYGGGLAQSGMTFYPAPSNASYTGTGELSFTVQADRRNFVAAYMDNVKLTEGEHFVLSDGSTILTLRESCLATLSSGTHKLRIVFHSGEGTATITVGVGYVPEEIELDPPKTGGEASAWIGILLVCLAGSAWMWLRRAR